MKRTKLGWVVAGAALAVASFVTAQIAGTPWKPAGSLPAVKGKQTVMVQVQPDGNRALTMRYRIPDLQLEETVVDPADGKRTRLILGNAPLSGKKGEPVMPVIPVQFVVPVGKEIETISVKGEKKQSLSLPFAVEYGSTPMPLIANAKVTKTVPDAAIYSSDNAFPAQNNELVSVQSKRGVQIGIMNLLPVSYFPKARRVDYSREFEIKVTFKSVANANSKSLRLRSTKLDLKKLGVENPEAIEDYRDSDSKASPAASPIQMLLDPAESFQYVVITSETIRDATTDVTVRDLIAFRQSLGLTATLVTLESIIADYTGTDNQEKVRNFIIDAYTNWETEFVVLGGDVSIIPIRDLFVDDDGGSSIHSDLYYQCLDGSFNGDGDRYWGEPTDGEDGGDVDLFAEVNVGRISAETPEEMSNAIYKILAYERENDSEDYLRSSCLVGEFLGSHFGPGEFGFAHPYMNELRNGSSAAGYSTVGFVACPAIAIDSLDDFDAEWPVDSLINRINAEKYSIINHLGHANTDYVMKMSNDQADRLTNNKFPFVYTQGCFPGDLTVDCIAERLTTSTRHGLFAGVFNSHYGWGAYNESYDNLDGPSQRIHRQFWDAYLGEYIYNLGAINADSHEDNVWNIGGDLTRWCIYETNLFGDPYTVIRGQTEGPKVVFSTATVDDRIGGNGDRIINPGERFNLSLALRNIGNGAATGVSATLNINDPFISITSGNLSYGDMPCCGVITQSTNNAVIAVAADCPTPYAFPINVEITDNSGNSWVATFTLTAYTSYTISGRVLTLTGSDPVENARIMVTGPLSGQLTTNAAGEYLFAGIEGTYSVQAQAAGYLPNEPVSVVLPPNAVDVDFLVSRPLISVAPVSISHQLVVNDSVELPLTITNSGDAVLDFTIAAQDNTAAEALSAKKLYDASHFVKQKKGTPDTRIGKPVALGSGGPDVFGYRWVDSDELSGPAYEWNDISETGELLSTVSDCDDCYEPRSLTFDFPFYGVDFSSVYIGSNGYLTFGEGSSNFWNVPLPSIEAPANLVAAFLDDLFPGAGGDVYFQDFGTYAVVQFSEVAYYSQSGDVTFQIVINRNGTITYYYKALTGSVADMTAGIQNATQDDGLTVVYNAAYLKNEFAVRLRPTPGWLTVSPEEGSVPAAGSTQLTVKLSSAELLGGEYTGSLNINHNDPQHPGQLSVPVSLSVDGFKSLTADPASVSFGNLWLGLKDTMMVTLANTGTQSTVVSAIVSDNPIYSVNASLPLRVRPGRTVDVGIVYAPLVLGPSSANLTVTSDAEDNSTITVSASAVATRGPDAELSPLAMTFDLGPRDAPADQTAVLANIGGDVLSYRAVIRQTGKPAFSTGTAQAAKKKARNLERLIYSPYNYRHEFALDRVIVAFDEGKTNFANLSLAAQLGSGNVRELATARIPKKGIRAYNGKKLVLVPLANNSREGVLEAIKLIRQDGNVAYVEPDFIVKAIGVPNDPMFAEQYALNNSGQTGGTADADIDAVEAWDTFNGENSDVILGIIDTGIDYLHPDLAGNIWTNPGEVPGNGIDDDGNGFVDDVHGYDFAYDDNDPMDVYGHGTHCAGIAAGRGNDATGICGVSWGAKLMAVKFLDDGGSGSTSDAIDAIVYATAMGATITSNSWGGGGYEQSLIDAIAASGLFVAAAGNNGSDADQWPMYPAAYELDNIISVAATDHNDELAYFSNWGLTSVDLGAPGVDILSALPDNRHEAWSGTSMATPHVSGCAVLLKTYNSMITIAELKEAIMKGVDVIPALEGKTVTGGRLNLVKALESVTPPWITLAPMTPGTIDYGSEQQFTVTANPAGLLAGTWVADIVFKTDDPFNPDHILTVTANIAPCRALRSASQTLAFNTVWATRDSMADVVFINDCNAPVTVSSLAFTDAVFTSTQTVPFTIRPFGSFNLPVRFSPLVAGKYDATVTLVSDAEDNPTLTVGLSGTSVTPPIIAVSPTAIDRTLAYEAIQNVPVTLTNTGGADFQFKTKTLPPPRSAGAPRTGIGDAIVFVALDDNTIRKVNPETGEFIGASIAKPGREYTGPEGLAFDGDNLYYVQESPEIYVIDVETGEIVKTIDCQVGTAYIDGLGVTQDYLILSDYGYERVFVCEKATGNLVSQWDVNGFMGGLGASESRQSVFLANYDNNTIEERSLLDGAILNSFDTRYGGMGVGFSEAAKVLFVASPYSSVMVMDPDDGTELAAFDLEGCWALAADEGGESVKWLQADVAEGTVPAGQSVTFNAVFNAATKLPGTYAATMQIQHIRPFAPGPFDIGCTMTVLPEKRCAASPASLSYTETWVGRTDTLPLYLVNTGNAGTSVTSIVSNNALFTPFVTAPLIIPPFDSVLVPVGFTPRRAATVTGNLTVSSDAVRSPSVTVSLRGVGLNPPRISHSPSRIARTMLPGTEQQSTISLRNTGGADYRFKVSVESIESGSAALGQAKLIGINWQGVYNLDPTTGALISSVSGQYAYGQSAFDGQHLYVARDWSDSIDVIDPATGVIVRSMRLAGNESHNVYEMGVSDRYLFTLNPDYSDTAKGYKITVVDKTDGSVQYSWAVDWSIEGLCNGKDAGTLFTYNYQSQQLETRRIETGEIIATVNLREYGYYLTYSRALDALYMANGYDVTVVNPATGEVSNSFSLPDFMYLAADEAGGVSWLTPSVDSSMVAARGSFNLVMTFNTARMLPGTYQANVVIAHHKGWTPGPFVIPCELTVLPIKRMAVTPGTLDFGSVWIGKDSIQTLTLTNSGNATTTVYSIANLNSAFTFDPQAPISVGPFSSVKVNAKFTPTNTRGVRDVAGVISDAIDLPLRIIRLSGSGVNPPAITVNPTQFNVQLAAGGSSRETLRLTNTGGAGYAFRVSGNDLTPGSGAVMYVGQEDRILQLDPETFEAIGDPIIVDPGTWVEGLAWDGQFLYLPKSYSEEGILIFKIDPANPTDIDTIRTGIQYGWISGLGVTGDMLLAMDSDYNTVYFLDKSTGATIRTVTTYGYGAVTAAATRGSFFVFNWDTWTIDELNLADGSLKNQFAVPAGIDYPSGAAFSNAANALYLCTYSGLILKLDPDNGTVISTYETGFYDMYGMAADEAASLPKWIKISMLSGTVPAGSALDIGITFDAAEVVPGSFTGEIKISPMVPGAPGPFTIPCNLSVSESEAARR